MNDIVSRKILKIIYLFFRLVIMNIKTGTNKRMLLKSISKMLFRNKLSSNSNSSITSTNLSDKTSMKTASQTTKINIKITTTTSNKMKTMKTSKAMTMKVTMMSQSTEMNMSSRMELFIRDSGRVSKDMVTVYRYGPMEPDMKESGRGIKLMGRANSGTWTVIYLMGSGKMIRLMDMVSINM